MFSTRARPPPSAALKTEVSSASCREIASALSTLVRREDLTTQELTLIRNLVDASKFSELVGAMRALLFTRVPGDAVEMVRDLARVDASVPMAVAIARLLGAPDGGGQGECLGAEEAGRLHALQIVRALEESISMQGAREPVEQERIQALNERAHALNELLPPRWPDVFKMVWRRVCGVRIVAPDGSMTKGELIRRFVDVSPEEVDRLENLQQGTQEWLDARRFRISGSTVASLVNLSPYASFDEWVVDKLFHHTYSNAAMRHGSRTEAGARMLFERAMRLLGLKDSRGRLDDESFCVQERGFMINPEMGGWAGASPDGLVRINGQDAVLEIKCPFYDRKTFYSERDKYHLNPWGIPEQYYCQIQYLMHLLRRPFSYFVVHLPEKTQIMYFRYNRQFASALYDTAREVFYHRFLPTAVEYFRGQLPFGCASVQDVIDLRDAAQSTFCTKRRRVAEPQAAEQAAEQAPEERASDADAEREARSKEVAEAEARIRDGLDRIQERNDHDRYSWAISVCNFSVVRLASLVEDSSCVSTEKQHAVEDLLRLLPSYAIEDSSRGRQLCDAFIRAFEHSPAAAAKVLVEHAHAPFDKGPVDLASAEAVPFEEPNEEAERALHAALLSPTS